jgi:SAM-dependent methyltransferase
MATTVATLDAVQLAEIKAQTRRTWAAGNYDAVAGGVIPLAARLVEALDIRPGERVLDVACGTGNAALEAAVAGAQVTGLDLTPELLEPARRRQGELGVTADWLAGDAEELPFPDESFDVAVSTIGVMFAPRQEVAAREIARVVRPGGRLGISSWRSEGPIGLMFRTVGSYLPARPGVPSPLLWGDEEQVRRLFEGTGIELEFTRAQLEMKPVAPEGVSPLDHFARSFGPLVRAREALEPQGRWDDLYGELERVFDRLMSEPADYLQVTGVKRS